MIGTHCITSTILQGGSTGEEPTAFLFDALLDKRQLDFSIVISSIIWKETRVGQMNTQEIENRVLEPGQVH